MRLLKFAVWVALHIGLLGLLLLAASAAGSLFLKRLRFHSIVERSVFSILLGLSVCSLLLFALALCGVLYKELVLAITAVAATVRGIGVVAAHRISLLSLFSRNGFRIPRLSVAALALLVIGSAFWGLLLAVAHYPPIHWDATAYHLVLARGYLTQHYMAVHTGVPVPVTPALNHMLFAWGLALKDDVLAQVIEHALMIAVSVGLFMMAKREGKPALGLAGGAFWLAHPLVLWLGQSAYVDVGVTAFAFFGVCALRVWWKDGLAGWWVLGMSLFGAAAGVKMHGLFFLGLGGALGLWGRFRSRIGWRSLALGLTVGLLIAGPWYLFIFHHTGNPFWPTLAHLSRGAWGDQTVVMWNDWVRSLGVPRTPLNFLLLPYTLSFETELFVPDRNLPYSPFLTIWVTAWAVSFFDRSVRWWTGWALAFTAFWFLSSQQERFLLPAIPLMIAALFESLDWVLTRLSWSRALRLGVLVVAGVFSVFEGSRFCVSQLARLGIPPIGPIGRDLFLSKEYAGFRAVRYINQHAEPEDAVYVINGSWLNYHFKPRVVDVFGLLQRRTWPVFRWPEDEAWLGTLKAEGVNWIFVYHDYFPSQWTLRKDEPDWLPPWQGFRLAYSEPGVWVFRRE